MPVNDFQTLQRLVARGVLRDDLALDYGLYINQGLREIQDRRSWSFMRRVADLTILSGTSSIPMPADFKELVSEKPPVSVVLDDPDFPGMVLPVDVVFENQELRRIWAMGGLNWAFQGMVWAERLWLDRAGDGALSTLNLIIPASFDLPLRVRYYGFLPDLVNPGDVSPIAAKYPWMVVNKAKAIALDSINDPYFTTLEADYEAKFTAAAKQDAYADVTGRATRM